MRRPDKSKARSLLDAATREMRFTLTLPVHEDSSSTIVRNVYECFRMLGAARLELAAMKSADHDTQIRELTRMNVSARRPLEVVEHLRRTRNNINYRGYVPSVAEAKDALDVADACFDACVEKLQSEINEA